AALLVGPVAGLTAMASREGDAVETRWSPYQKLELTRTTPAAANQIGAIGTWAISGNNVDYTENTDGRTGLASTDREHYPPEQRGYSQYDLPARFHPAPHRMLI